MPANAFKTNPVSLKELLTDAHAGKLQLPDFQRSWVWDEDRIKSLLASVSRAFPIGAIMTLESGNTVNFKPRPVEGAPAEAGRTEPEALLLDGQQRITSLYQVAFRGQVVATMTPRKRRVKRWFYIDIMKALDPEAGREEAIIGVPEDRIVRSDFGRTVEWDLSTRQREIENLMYPAHEIFAFDSWQTSFIEHHMGAGTFSDHFKLLTQFKDEVLNNFTSYFVPVIALDRETSKEAVCVVFEKVNTGGKALDAFELITAMYAADGHELRKDWYGQDGYQGRHDRLRAYLSTNGNEGILTGVGNTDFLHVISLFHTRERRREAERQGRSGKELPQVIGNRAALLNLPLAAYLKYEEVAEQGFKAAAKFLRTLRVYRTYDLPYQTQIIPMAAILADHPDILDNVVKKAKLAQWYWNGVFGELYGSSVETRIARDFMEVPAWIDGGPVPNTVDDSTFRYDRLLTMRMRLSAAYKGVNALLMETGSRDFRSGLSYSENVFFEDGVDIHHIFPQDWCKKQGIDRSVYDSIINKTPLSAKTNRVIGGVAPSAYVEKLERGDEGSPGVPEVDLDDALMSHLIDPVRLRADDFAGFMSARQDALAELIQHATGKSVFRSIEPEEGEDLPYETEEEEDEPSMILS